MTCTCIYILHFLLVIMMNASFFFFFVFLSLFLSFLVDYFFYTSFGIS